MGETTRTTPLDGDIIGPREGLVTVAEDVPRDDRLNALEHAALTAMGMAAGLSFFAHARLYEVPLTSSGSRYPLLESNQRDSFSYNYEQRKRRERQALAAVQDRTNAKQNKAARKKKEAARARARNKHR